MVSYMFTYTAHGRICFQASEEHLKQHYADLSSKPFFGGLVKYMASGPVVPMVSTVDLLQTAHK